MSGVRIVAKLRDGLAPGTGIEQVRSQVIFWENLP